MDLTTAKAILNKYSFIPGESSTRDFPPDAISEIKAACSLLNEAARPRRLSPIPAAPAPHGHPRMPEDVPPRGDRPALIPPGTPRPARLSED